MTVPDVVYVLGPGHRPWLRWSLRSLAHLPHGRVWVAGHKPAWVTGVRHVPVRQSGSPFVNSDANLRAACAEPELSGSFVLMNDDFYIIDPIQVVPALHAGPAEEFIAAWRAPWADGLRVTVELLNGLGHTQVNSYELHVPMACDKRTMARVLDLGRGLGGFQKRTAYGVVAGVGGQRVDDCKVRTTPELDP